MSELTTCLPSRAAGIDGGLAGDGLSAKPTASAAAHATTATHGPVTVIEPDRGLASLGLGELARRFDVVLLLVWRDVKARFKQTTLGWVWWVIQPVMTVTVLTLVFGHVARLPSQGVPYALFVFGGLLPWQYFATAMSRAAASMTANGQLLKKVYVPRLSIPLAAVLSAAVDALVSAVLLIGLMAWYGAMPGWRAICAPLLLLVAGTLAWGVGSVLAALNCRFRDVGHALPMGLQLCMYLTPVIYPLGMGPEWIRTLLLLNPMTGVVVAFRWSIYGTPLDVIALVVCLCELAVVLLLGAVAFARLERGVIDYL